MKKAILILVALSCTNNEGARHTLAADGFTDVKLTGYAMTECAKSDDTCTGFEATSPSGQHVSGAVGCGYDVGGCGKGCTVRIK